MQTEKKNICDKADLAFTDAVSALELSPDERAQRLKALFDNPVPTKKRRLSGAEDQQQDSKRRRRETSVESSASASKSKFTAIEEKIQSIPAEVLEKYRRKLKTGFKLFQIANIDFGDDLEIDKEREKELNKEWNKQSVLERKFYQEQAAKIFEPEEEEQQQVLPSGTATPEPAAEDDNESVTSSVKSNTNDTPKRLPKAEMIGQFKKESCCLVCEEVSRRPGDIVRCRGICQNSFHRECISLDKSTVVDLWKCPECSTGKYRCHLCKSDEGVVLRCNSNGCGRFYHRKCLLETGLWPQARLSEKQLTCPAHMCHTCASDNPKEPFMKYNKPLLKCIRCPTAYHSGDFCVAAGSIQITASQIVCPKHYVPPPSKKGNSASHVNANW